MKKKILGFAAVALLTVVQTHQTAAVKKRATHWLSERHLRRTRKS